MLSCIRTCLIGIVLLVSFFLFPSPSYATQNPTASLWLSSDTGSGKQIDGFIGQEITATVTIPDPNRNPGFDLLQNPGFIYTYRLEIGDDWSCTDPGNCGADDKYGKISVQIKDGYVLTYTFESGFAWDITTFNFTPDPLTPTTGTVTFQINIIVDNLTGEANNQYVVRVKSSPDGNQTIWDKALITKINAAPSPTPTPWPTPTPAPKSGPYSYVCEFIDGQDSFCGSSDNPDAFCDAQASCSGSGVYRCDIGARHTCVIKDAYLAFSPNGSVLSILPQTQTGKTCLVNPTAGGGFLTDGLSCTTDLNCHCMSASTAYACDDSTNTCGSVTARSLPSSCVNFADGLRCDITASDPHKTCRDFAGCDSYFCDGANECELGTPNYDLKINVFVDNVGHNCAVDPGDTGIANASIIVRTSEGVQLTPKTTDASGTVIFPSLPEGTQNVYLDPASVPQYNIVAQNPTTALLPPQFVLNYCAVPKATPTPTRTPTPPAPTGATLPSPPPISKFSIEGNFFFDDGAGGGTPNNGVKDGGESNQGQTPVVYLVDPNNPRGYVDRTTVARSGKYTFSPNNAGYYDIYVRRYENVAFTVPVPYPYFFFLTANVTIDFGVGVPTPTNTPTPTRTPTPSRTPTPVPPTSTPRPTVTSTPRPTATSTPRPTATRTPTPRPTATSTPRPTATRTPTPRPAATSTPTRTPTSQPTTTTAPTLTAAPTSTPQPAAPTPTSGGPTSGQPTTTQPTPTLAPSTPPHCALKADGTPDVDANGFCLSVDTAIGNIPTRIGSFINHLLGFLIGIGAGVAVLLIIYAGYILMTSQGNPEAIAKAKNILTAVIAGLLFLIFSIMLLEVITVDILHIPFWDYGGGGTCGAGGCLIP